MTAGLLPDAPTPQKAAADRLYRLLPAYYRQRDAESGEPLRALLGVIAEQVAVVEDDIERLWDNWFIETCDDWVVPYIGELVGLGDLRPTGGGVPDTEAGGPASPRREVGRAVAHFRRKGSASLLAELAASVGGWPCRIVEFERRLVTTRSLAFPRLGEGGTVDVRRAGAGADIGSPLGRSAHGVDLRRPQSRHVAGRYNLPSIGAFIWRLQVFPVTQMPARSIDRSETARYTFSVLGHDAPLFNRPQAAPEELTLPMQLTRGLLADRTGRVAEAHYGAGRSLALWRTEGHARQLIERERLVVADLSGWRLQPRAGTVAVDPELGRIAFAADEALQDGLRVSYQRAAGAALGGGEYRRPAARHRPGARLYIVGGTGEHGALAEALERWRHDRPADAVIELAGNEVHTDLIAIELAKDQRLEIRAGAGFAPLIALRDQRRDAREFLQVRGAAGSRLSLTGLLVAGRGLQVRQRLAALTIRHCTLVPGWDALEDLGGETELVASLRLENVATRVLVEASVIGAVVVVGTVAEVEPPQLLLRDSIIDATGLQRRAIDDPERQGARLRLTVERSTVIGRVQVTEMPAASDSLFLGDLRVERRQAGCLRHCYLPPGSRTPPRHACQPDLAIAAEPDAPAALVATAVAPRLLSLRHGAPGYARLADDAPVEIARGAEDGGEMGVFHRLQEPQRLAALQRRLEEFVPAESDVGIFKVT